MASLDHGHSIDTCIYLPAACRLSFAKQVGVALAFAGKLLPFHKFQALCSSQLHGDTPYFIMFDLIGFNMQSRPFRALCTSAAYSIIPESRHALIDKDPFWVPSVQEMPARLLGSEVTMSELPDNVDCMKHMRDMRDLGDTGASLRGSDSLPPEY